MAAKLSRLHADGRVDLRKVPLPTIDPEDARDHDDAVWVARTERGGYLVHVAIADVSSYVRPTNGRAIGFLRKLGAEFVEDGEPVRQVVAGLLD